MRQFNINHDLDEINSWLKDRGEEILSNQMYPQIGFIEPGVAVGFLFQAECRWAFLDAFVTNPKAKSEDRSLSIDKIAVELIRQAKLLGFTKIAVLTEQVSLADRCIVTHGFISKDSMIFLSLGV